VSLHILPSSAIQSHKFVSSIPRKDPSPVSPTASFFDRPENIDVRNGAINNIAGSQIHIGNMIGSLPTLFLAISQAFIFGYDNTIQLQGQILQEICLDLFHLRHTGQWIWDCHHWMFAPMRLQQILNCRCKILPINTLYTGEVTGSWGTVVGVGSGFWMTFLYIQTMTYKGRDTAMRSRRYCSL
jgi:hypothetical protein